MENNKDLIIFLNKQPNNLFIAFTRFDYFNIKKNHKKIVLIKQIRTLEIKSKQKTNKNLFKCYLTDYTTNKAYKYFFENKMAEFLFLIITKKIKIKSMKDKCIFAFFRNVNSIIIKNGKNKKKDLTHNIIHYSNYSF